MAGALEATQYGLRMLYDNKVRRNSGCCSQSVGDVLGFRLGNANQSHGTLQRYGWQARPCRPRLLRIGREPAITASIGSNVASRTVRVEAKRDHTAGEGDSCGVVASAVMNQ